jgi:hypothetical protein
VVDHWGVVVVGWPKFCVAGLAVVGWPVLFYRLFEAVAFAIHLEDVAMVGKSI